VSAHVSKRRLAVYLSLFLAFLTFAIFSRKYIWLYATRRLSPAPASTDLIHDPSLSQNPEILLAEANRLAWLSNWPKAEPLYVHAEELFREKGDTRNEVYAGVGRIRARSEQMSWVDVSKMLGHQLELPVAKTDQQLRLWCLVAKGYTDLDLNPGSAKRAWTEAKTIAHQLGEVQWEARAKGELGIIAFLEGDSRGAAMMVGDSLLSAMASGDEAGQVRMLEMLGNGFNEAKRYDEALAFFERAIKTSRGTPDAGFPYTAYEGEAYALLGEGKVSEAKNTLDRALRAARESQKLGHESMILQLLGELAMRTGDRQAATRYLEQACKIAQEFKFYRMLGQSMIDLAELYRNDGDLKTAEMRAAIGVDASRRVGDRYYLPRDLTILADLKDRQGATGEAEALYENAEDVIDGMLVNVNEAYWTSSLAGAMSDIYVRHFELEVRRGNVERALSVVERVRGRTVAALLQNKPSFAEKESSEVQVLGDFVSDLQLRLMRSEDANGRVVLLDQLMEYERRLDWTRTKEVEPDFRRFGRSASLREIRSVLGPKELVLEYVLSEPQSYCIWISRNRAGVQILSAGRKEIGDLVESYLSATRAGRDNPSAASRLHAILFGQLPPEVDKENIIVVPDGVLHLLPFDTLRDSSGALILEAHTVSYIPAVTVLRILRNEKPFGTRKHVLLGVGDVVYQNQGHVAARLAKPLGVGLRLERRLSDAFGTGVYDLPQTREEVLTISRILGNDSILLLGRDATETEFKSKPLSEFKIVHIAAHGFADTRFPERSGLVLGIDMASHDDGLLQVKEIIRLRFNADLVTLSACNTGVGKLEGEEGVTNLVEAFLMSGAKSVVASLWSADDTYTLDLMERFYTHIAEGQDKATALRQAKLDLLAKFGKQVPPYYWGAFVLVGDGGSPIPLRVQ
jgi:CHAT domain-containing protein/tetratricopeptide (TPR) repeat protein